MMKISYFIVAIAITGMTFTGCQKAELSQAELGQTKSSIANLNKSAIAPICEDVLPMEVDELISSHGFTFHVFGTLYICENTGRICSSNLNYKLFYDLNFQDLAGYVSMDSYLSDNYPTNVQDNDFYNFNHYVNNSNMTENFQFNFMVGNINFNHEYIKTSWCLLLERLGMYHCL